MLSRVCGCILAAAVLVLANTASGQPMRQVTVSLASTSFATAPARIAKELGLYERHGLDVKFVVMDSASAATTALISGSVDFALAGPGELIIAQARGQKVVLIANIYSGLSGSLVLSKALVAKLGIPHTAPVAERLKALDGLVIGAPSATGAYTVSIRGAATAAGASVHFTYMGLPAMPAALESGAIQGFVAGAPFWGFPVTHGSGVLWLSGPKGDIPARYMPASSANLQAMRQFADANPAIVANMQAVFADLSKAIGDRPAEVKAAVARLYPDLDAPTLDLLFASEALAWKPERPSVTAIRHEIDFVKSIGTALPNIDTIDPASMLYP